MKGLQLIQEGEAVDLAVSGGEMLVGDTQAQEEYLTLVSHKGEWKEFPMVGVGIADMAGDEDLRYWKREITESLARVGIKIKGVSLKNGILEIKH